MEPPAAERETVVLVVEDDPMIRMAAMMLIEGLGYYTLEATNADEAITLLEDHPEITIVFTDVQMEGSMDGIALTHWAAGRWPPLRFIIVSGGMTPELHEIPAGAIFLSKPYADATVGRLIAQFA
ncbi:response regulator [Sphingomonas echinoides]|uniref:Response regulator n=1 Tax=Sphingomonas echinoides TaxID=59803 RepID=A0ABU4PQM9_9SPHN|nr:response regulator [Sphingomonas echinoides]MDX5986117.1 response regulator [Sphingomonas echinoides]